MLGVGVSQGLVRPKQFLGGHGTATSPELGGNFVGRAESRQLWCGWWVGGAVYQGTGTTELPDTVLPLNLLALIQVCHQPWPGLSLHSGPRRASNPSCPHCHITWGLQWGDTQKFLK